MSDHVILISHTISKWDERDRVSTEIVRVEPIFLRYLNIMYFYQEFVVQPLVEIKAFKFEMNIFLILFFIWNTAAIYRTRCVLWMVYIAI
jgi:hypothetical protein